MTTITRRHRAGYSMIELLIVVVILGVVFAIAVPQMTTIREDSTLRAGRQQLSAAFSAARAAALQKGRHSALVMHGNEIRVKVYNGVANTRVTVFGPMRLDHSLGITLERLGTAPDSVDYNARGMMTNVVPDQEQALRYRLRYGTKADTLCISSAGLILPKGCHL